MATEVPQTLEYKGGQLNVAHVPEAANLDQRLKSLIMYVLLNDQMNFVINCKIAKSTWKDLILYYKGPSDVKESRVMDLKLFYNTFKLKEGDNLTQTFTKYKALMNKLVNDGIKLSKLEINTGFINGLPKKWLSFCQSLRNTNHVKEYELASLFGKLKFKENLIDDFQDSPDDEEDTRSSEEYLKDLEEEYQERALLAKSKRSFKEGSQRFGSAKATNDTICLKYGRKGHFARECFSKTSVPSYSSPFQNNTQPRFSKWDEEDVSSDDNEMTEVKVLMALVDYESIVVGKESARNREWVKITMKNVHTLLDMEDNDERKSFLDYLCIDLNYVEEQRNNLVLKHRDLVQELNTCKEQLLVLKQAKLDFLTMQHVNTEILKENKNLRKELKELTSITEAWLNSSNKVNQCINKQIPSQKKRILGLDQLTEDPSGSRQTDLVFVKSSAEDTKLSIPESQMKITDPSVAITDSSSIEYDSADESSVCSTPLPPLEKLAGAEPISGPKTIKSILKSDSTFKAESSKGVNINEPSSAPAKGNKNDSASKNNSAPTGKLKNVKSEDDSLVISLRRGIKPRNPQHVSKSCETCGSTVHTITDHNDIEWFRKGEALQAKKAETFQSNKTESSNANISKTPTKSGYSRHMTGVKSYLHKYVEQPGPKVVFGDDSTCITEGYGSIKCNEMEKLNVSNKVSCDAGNESSMLNSVKANLLAAKVKNVDGTFLPRRYTTYQEPLKDKSLKRLVH
ncbi:hypothetical protein Tco_1054137 [Tanacetum coccineum]|uniref:CCHC-type domain-containing protein n=1 Tax=Tanacetum coccineum TaxID=301880 RepID=A0ABQ5GWK1_9ASTR